jgi:hypothetical protein
MRLLKQVRDLCVVMIGLFVGLGIVTPAASDEQPIHIVLVHGLWALPESLFELGDNLRALHYVVHFVTYDTPRTCKELGDTVKSQFEHLVVTGHLDRGRTYMYGYSLGAMGVALANLDVDGIILDAPANYSELACHDLPQFMPNGPYYEVGTHFWRWNSDNRSPAVDMFKVSNARILVLGHLDDRVIPQATVRAFATAPFASTNWVPGTHTPIWPAVAMSIDQFVQMGLKFQISARK